jgi:hypothetical protein
MDGVVYKAESKRTNLDLEIESSAILNEDLVTLNEEMGSKHSELKSMH